MKECDYCGERKEFFGFEEDGTFMCDDCEKSKEQKNETRKGIKKEREFKNHRES